jgi:hypothetical protein
VASVVGRALGFGSETRDWPVEEALAAWGASAITTYGSNSRVRSFKARQMLGWGPEGPMMRSRMVVMPKTLGANDTRSEPASDGGCFAPKNRFSTR